MSFILHFHSFASLYFSFIIFLHFPHYPRLTLMLFLSDPSPHFLFSLRTHTYTHNLQMTDNEYLLATSRYSVTTACCPVNPLTVQMQYLSLLSVSISSCVLTPFPILLLFYSPLSNLVESPLSLCLPSALILYQLECYLGFHIYLPYFFLVCQLQTQIINLFIIFHWSA